MNTHFSRLPSALTALSLLALTANIAIGASPKDAPDSTPDGLVRVAKSEAALVYVRPGVDFSKYDAIILVEPTIAFRANWKSDVNVNRPTDRVTDADMTRMIETGKQLLIEEFGDQLKKGGYKFATAPGPGAIAVKPAVWDLDIYAPDPDNTAGLMGGTYANGSGEATMQIQIFDSVSGQKLADAYDRRGNSDNGYSWRTKRTQTSNKADVRIAFANWAQMLVEGLKRTKAAGTPSAAK
jgi:hypothetical protein